MSSKLQVMIVALVCSFTSVSATNVQHSQMHAYLPLYSGQAFNPAHFPQMLPPATSPQSPISEGVLRSKGLGLIDLILLKQLTSRISRVEETAKILTSSNSQLEETVNNLTISNNELEGTVNNLTISNSQLERTVNNLTISNNELEGTVNNLTISNSQLEGTVNNLTISNNQLEETVKNLTSSSGQGGSGQPTSIGGMPKSCDDLQKLGNSKSGFYNIKNTTEVGTVFCDFTKSVGDAEFQKWIGNADIKSTPVYFYVQKKRQLNANAERIPFETVKLNKGGAMNETEGIFTAPITGTYFFAFTGTVKFVSASVSRRSYTVDMILNGATVGSAQIDESNVEVSHNDSLHLEATLLLNKDDQIWLKATQSPGIFLEGFAYSHFTGMLLAENIFPAA